MAAGRVLGLTGDVGAGKSTVRAWLEARGVIGLDADAVVHRLLAEDQAIKDAVTRRFGTRVAPGGVVDRAALGAIVFGQPEALADLEAILHPAVLVAVRGWLAAIDARWAVVEAIKLLEGGLGDDVDAVWLVTCARPVRRARLVARGWTTAEAEQRMAVGPALASHLARADVVIDNSGPWPATERQLAVAWARWAAAGGHDA